MRILLPPSEGKTPPTDGAPLVLEDLSFPSLTPVRRTVLDQVVQVSRQAPEQMAAALRLSPRLAPEIERNAHLLQSPAAPACEVFTGVLFGALDAASLPAEARAGDCVIIASGLFGLVGWHDHIPAYRLPGTATVPGLPSLRRLWSAPSRAVLAEVADAELIIDLRSGTYADWYRPRREGWVSVRVIADRGGRRVTVSHHNKATKGRVARDLLLAQEHPTTVLEMVSVLRDAGWETELADGELLVVARP